MHPWRVWSSAFVGRACGLRAYLICWTLVGFVLRVLDWVFICCTAVRCGLSVLGLGCVRGASGGGLPVFLFRGLSRFGVGLRRFAFGWVAVGAGLLLGWAFGWVLVGFALVAGLLGNFELSVVFGGYGCGLVVGGVFGFACGFAGRVLGAMA